MQQNAIDAAASSRFRRLARALCQWLLVACLLLLPSSFVLFAQTANQDVLTNEGVVELVKAKVGESVIIGMIRTMPTQFSLNKDAVIRLKQQGVPDKVLAAMVSRSSSANSSAGSSPAVGRNQPLSAAERQASAEMVGTWEMRDRKDPMTDVESYEAHLVVKNDAREKIEVTATCSSSSGGGLGNLMASAQQALLDQMKSMSAPMGNSSGQAAAPLPPIEDMNFEINYLPKAGQSLERVTAPMTGKVERAPEIFGTPIGDDTVTVRGGESCVHVSMRLGDMYYRSVNAGGCGKRNTLALTFSSSDPKGTDFIDSKNITDSVLRPLLNSYVEGSLIAARGYNATLKDVEDADKFLVGLPMVDGTMEVVPIATTEPSFRKFAARCDADYAKLLPPPPAPAPPRPLPSLVRPGTTVSPWVRAMLNPPKFTGTADQFAAALPGFLQKAAAVAGFDANAFAKESAFVIDSVRTCREITPEMATQATNPMGHRVVTRTLGQQYVVCQFGGGTDTNAQYPDTRIELQLETGEGENYRQGKGFTTFVFFAKAGQGTYPIVSATIQ